MIIFQWRKLGSAGRGSPRPEQPLGRGSAGRGWRAPSAAPLPLTATSVKNPTAPYPHISQS